MAVIRGEARRQLERYRMPPSHWMAVIQGEARRQLERYRMLPSHWMAVIRGEARRQLQMVPHCQRIHGLCEPDCQRTANGLRTDT